MTEFQFLDNMSFYQRRFERLHFTIIRDMKRYVAQNPIHDSVFIKKIEGFSYDIALTGQWIKLLKDFNADKYNNMNRLSIEFNCDKSHTDAIRRF